MAGTSQEVIVGQQREEQVCPRCGEGAHALITDYIGLNAGDCACSRCVDQLEAALLKTRDLAPEVTLSPVAGGPIVFPTPLRLNADPRFAGRGVTICFIDSGFFPHPDLIQPRNRILCTVDITSGQTPPEEFAQPHDDNWHGTMTSVVCSGSGFLSQGFYRGIAHEAQLVLLKVKDERGISGSNIAKAIRWAIEHKDQYNVRIINLSVADDEPVSYRESEVDQAAEEAVREGIVVVAAVGNDPTQQVKPPANSPNVIAVGGVDDHNTLGMMNESIYHSTFGTTADQLLKPELIAPSIWLAAPILPMTQAHAEARGLFNILAAEDRQLKSVLVKEIASTGFPASRVLQEAPHVIREIVKGRINEAKYISGEYMHADGTSFAAPIVCSIVAQMLEANPRLTPASVRHILITTARKLGNVPIERQGHGVVTANEAVRMSLAERHTAYGDYPSTPIINGLAQRTTFYYHNDAASRVALAGTFNGWQPTVLFVRNGNGIWKAEIPILPSGTYLYKFIVDNRVWVDDPENLYREPDEFSGFNSRFTIE